MSIDLSYMRKEINMSVFFKALRKDENQRHLLKSFVLKHYYLALMLVTICLPILVLLALLLSAAVVGLFFTFIF